MVALADGKHRTQPKGDLMDSDTYANWKKVKAALEKAGKTDCFYYKRAIAILSGKPDPLR